MRLPLGVVSFADAFLGARLLAAGLSFEVVEVLRAAAMTQVGGIPVAVRRQLKPRRMLEGERCRMRDSKTTAAGGDDGRREDQICWEAGSI